jgi:hypothetical protein
MCDVELHCYNLGCGKKFKECNNHAKACTFHSGKPYFHDAYKHWTCCDRKSSDFSEFMAIAGCTIGFHNKTKPPEPVKQKVVDDAPNRLSLEQVRIAERPPEDAPMVRLQVNVASSLKNALAKLKAAQGDEKKDEEKVGEVKATGMPCKNNGCPARVGEVSENQPCVYHPGNPVFHEGFKFWSCCEKRTTDFNAFLEQKPCVNGTHVWGQKEDASKVKSACRTDWHQTVPDIFFTAYAKNCDPDLSYVEASPVKLHLHLIFGDNIYDETVILSGVVDLSQSSVTLSGAKAEVKLRKSEAGQGWSSLQKKEGPMTEFIQCG